MKKLNNKILILICFILIIGSILILNKEKNRRKQSISEEDARNKILQVFSDNKIEKIENQSLVITKNDEYMIMVIGDQYILTDFSKNPPIIHHYKSIKPDIKVKVLKIENDGYLVEHDNHEHFVNGKLDENIKEGDYVIIKDPHTYIQDNHSNNNN